MSSRAQLTHDLMDALDDLAERAAHLDASHVSELIHDEDASFEDLRKAVDSHPDDDIRADLQATLDDIETLAVRLYLRSVSDRQARV